MLGRPLSTAWQTQADATAPAKPLLDNGYPETLPASTIICLQQSIYDTTSVTPVQYVCLIVQRSIVLKKAIFSLTARH